MRSSSSIARLSITSWTALDAPEIIADLFLVSTFWLVDKRVCDEAALRGWRPTFRGGLNVGLFLITDGNPFLVGIPCSKSRFYRSLCKFLFSTN